MARTWIVIAHRAGARIFEQEARGRELARIRELDNEAGRRHNREIDADRPGRVYDRMGQGRHAVSREDTPHEKAAEDFAKELAGELQKGRNENRFNEIVLAAEPRFLGMLRQALDEPTARLVTAELPKDLAEVRDDKLSGHLGTVMAV
jgi:protein required for attachment to host cells